MAESKEEKGCEVVDKRRVKLDKDGQVSAEAEEETASGADSREHAPMASDETSASQSSSEAGGQAEAEPKEATTQEQAAGEEKFTLPPVDVYLLLKSFIGLLGAHAWQWMGLVKNPATGQIEKDMAQAKVAIDSISALINQLEGKVDPAEQRELRGMLSDLQVNFVRQSTTGS